MGLDELIPDDADTSSRSSSRGGGGSSQKTEDDEDLISFGSDPHKKTFTEERWDRIRKVIERDFGLNVNQVVNNYPAQERHKVLHEAALEEASETDTPTSEMWKEERCPICDHALKDSAVELGAITICRHHPAWIIEEELELEDICDES